MMTASPVVNINNFAENDAEIGESTPLLRSQFASSIKNKNKEVLLSELKGESFKEQLVAITASVSVFSSLLSLLFESSLHPVVWLSSIFGILLSPLAAFQQCKLTQVEALQETNRVFEEEVNQLTEENQKLSATVQTLEESVLNLQAMEETLETLQSIQGQSVNELEKQLHDSQIVLAQMKQSVGSELLQNLITVLLACDTDGNMLLSDDEIQDWMHHIEGIHGVELRHELFRQTIIEHGRSLPAIMEVMRQFLTAEESFKGGGGNENNRNGGNGINGEETIFQFIKEEN